MARTIRFIGTRAELSEIVRDVVQQVSGKQPDTDRLGAGFLLTLGFAALSDIKDAYITKSRGGTDEMGIKWPKLSRAYLAYGRRFGRGEQAQLRRKAFIWSKGARHAPGGKKGLLTKAQLKRWRQLYAQYFARYQISEGTYLAKRHAAAVAWTILKSEGAKTKLQVYGNREVDILRDTGVMLNSLSPGRLTGKGDAIHYAPPGGEGGDQQIMRAELGAIVVGTNVPYAGAHQDGRGVPQRKVLPDESTPAPAVWWDRWTDIAGKALREIVAWKVRHESGTGQAA